MNAADRILDAAERVVLRDGAARLTLDAVAQEAAVSKGGLLYHFRSKDDLVRAMLARLSGQLETDVERLASKDPCCKGRHSRAYIDACFPKPKALSRRAHHVWAGLLAAIAMNPALLAPVRGRMKAHRGATDGGLDPVLAAIIHLAVDGLWMSDLVGGHVLTAKQRSSILARLRELSRGI